MYYKMTYEVWHDGKLVDTKELQVLGYREGLELLTRWNSQYKVGLHVWRYCPILFESSE